MRVSAHSLAVRDQRKRIPAEEGTKGVRQVHSEIRPDRVTELNNNKNLARFPIRFNFIFPLAVYVPLGCLRGLQITAYQRIPQNTEEIDEDELKLKNLHKTFEDSIFFFFF